MCPNASSVSTSDSVARIAASDSALPDSVPPIPPTSVTFIASKRDWIRPATSELIP